MIRMPRRVRRQLSYRDALPSNWLGIWFLLLLVFCSELFPQPAALPALGIQWPTRLGGSCSGGMLQLTLPPRHPSAAERKSINWPYKPARELATARQWHTINLDGNAITDFVAFADAINAVKAMQADTSYKSGVRVCFHRRATFSSLAATLDMLNIFNQKRYWLALNREPLTLYIISIKPGPTPLPPLPL